MTDETADTAQAGARPFVQRRVVVVTAIVVAAVLVVVLGWQIAARSALGGVRVVYDARPIVCEGAEVGLHPSGAADASREEDALAGDEQFYEPVVGVVPGMTCGLRLHVVNEGWSDVDVRTVALPSMGGSFLSLVKPLFVNPNGQVRLADSEDAAVFAVDGLTVPARGSQVLTVLLEADEADADSYEPCSGYRPQSPEVTLSALGVDRTVAAPEGGVWYFDGPSGDCE